MRFVIVPDDASDEELREAIVNLREYQRRTPIPSTKDELDVEMGELLDRLGGDRPCAS